MKKSYLSLFIIVLVVALAGGALFAQNTNLLPNGDIETMMPNYWEKLNGDTECIWASDTAAATPNSRRSFKIVKTTTTSDVIGWRSVNNANLYWNHAGSEGADTYNLSFTAKTEGVNTNPANDDAKIGAWFKFYSGGNLLAEKFVPVDQSVASTNFTTYEDAVYVSGTPDDVRVELVMGKDATGTVWFDNIGCGTNSGWTMGLFNGDAETPVGWMNWSTDNGFANFVADTGAHSGDYSVLLKEEDDNDDEMVFYSEPVPAEAGKWYKISVWAKTKDINTNDAWMASNIVPDRDNDRLGLCFFFHKAPIETNWDLVGGDQFVYFDQRTGKENQGWTYYSVVAKAPEEAAGVSLRARFTSFPTGSVWYDDFSIEEIEPLDNIITNGDIETIEPNFWSKLNGDTECIWASDTAAATPNSRRSFKIVKTTTTSDVIGWRSANNANLYWNHAGSEGADTYNLSFTAKTEGVNTNPANDDAKIGAWFKFYSGGNLLAEKFVPVDQSVASTNFTTYEDAVYVSGTPDDVRVELVMGKDATGTVWFDNIGCGTNSGWTMGLFNGDAETPVGWMNWSTDNGFANFVEDDSAHSGSYSVLLKEEDDQDDEMVFYSEPAPAEQDKWYMITVWAKTDSINTADGFLPSYITPDRDNDRLGLCFFFHKAPIETNWDLVGGDQFVYFDQRPGKEKQPWTRYTVIAKAPLEAAGVSMRARFTSFPTGSVWYDDFSIQEVKLIETSIEDYGPKGVTVATEYMLKNNYPNPFNPFTHIEYYVPKADDVELVVYNVMGQKIRTLAKGFHAKGSYNVLWDGLDDFGNAVASGIYFYQLKGGNSVITKKMTFLK